MKKWWVLSLCLLLAGCGQTKEVPAGSRPAISIGNVIQVEGGYLSEDGRYWASWEDGSVTVTDLELDQEMEVMLPDGKTAIGEAPETMLWQSRDGYDHRLYLSTSQGDYLFIPHGWEEILSGDTFYTASEAIEGEYDFTQDGVMEEVSLLTVTDPNGTDVSWYELWVKQEGELLLREEFGTAHVGYNTLLACSREGEDYLLRYNPSFGMGYGYYRYELFTLGEKGETVQEGGVEFDANFGRPDYKGPYDAAAIAAYYRECYDLMEQSTLLFSTEGGVVRRDMSGGEFFRCVVTLPEDQSLWEAYLAPPEEIGYESLLASTPVAEVGGEAASPDGNFRLEAIGKSDYYASGVCPPEALRLVDQKGTVLWEDQGWAEQEICWSPDSRYAAIYTAARTWGAITVVDTQSAVAYPVKLPDGSSFGEYVFLDEMRWVEIDTAMYNLWFLLFDGEGTADYRYSPVSDTTFAQTTAILDSTYDFDHDGIMELVEIDTVYDGGPCYFEVRLLEQGEYLWMDEAYPAHAGWNTVLACKWEGEDYLLRYNPSMSTGCAGYSYELFSLDGAGNEIMKADDYVDFDVNFGSFVHVPLDVPAIADFLREAYGYLEKSTLLLSTEDGDLWPAMSGKEFFWKSGCYFDLPEDPALWEQAIRDCEKEETAARSEN